MSRHTKGPWRLEGPSSGKGPFDDGGDYAIVAADSAGAIHIIGEAFRKTDTNAYQPAKANGELMCAAPELLAALKEAIETIEIFHGPVGWEVYYNHSPEMKRFRAAIAKATGAKE